MANQIPKLFDDPVRFKKKIQSQWNINITPHEIIYFYCVYTFTFHSHLR